MATQRLIQVNTLNRTRQKVTLPITNLTLEEWATKFNEHAPAHITYNIGER